MTDSTPQTQGPQSPGGEPRQLEWDRPLHPVLTTVENLLYYAVAAMLVFLAGATLLNAGSEVLAAFAGHDGNWVVEVLDRTLIVLMIIEIFHTVAISLRTHTLQYEPFLVVALIASIRRILVITAEQMPLSEVSGEVFRRAMIEYGLNILFIAVLVLALQVSRRAKEKEE